MSTQEEQLFARLGREFPAGTVLFSDGDEGKNMYVVQSGLVQLRKDVRGIEKEIARIGAGEFLGEMSLLSDKPRTATAVILETAKMLVIDHKTFEAMIRGNIEVAVRLIRRMAARIQESNEQIENLMLCAPDSRVTHFITKKLKTLTPIVDSGAVTLDINVQELPLQLALRSEQVESVLQRLVSARLIEIHENAVTLTDIDRLNQYMNFLQMKERFGDI